MEKTHSQGEALSLWNSRIHVLRMLYGDLNPSVAELS